MLLSGLEPITIDSSSLFVNVGERTRRERFQGIRPHDLERAV